MWKKCVLGHPIARATSYCLLPDTFWLRASKNAFKVGSVKFANLLSPPSIKKPRDLSDAGQKSRELTTSPESPNKVACMRFSAINGSGPAYLSELLHVYTPSRTLRSSLIPACWKSNSTNARLVAFAPSLALDPTFGIHSHKTLDTAQPFHLLKPNWKPSSSHSIFIPTNISTQSRVFLFVFVFCIILYVDCFGRIALYMCTAYPI